AVDDLKAVLAEVGMTAEACSTALNEHEVMYRQVKRPFADRRKIADTIAPEVETLLPVAEDINVDFVILGKDAAGETILEAAAAKSAAVDKRVAECTQAGIDPEVIEAPSSALASGARNLFTLGPEQGYVILHIGWRHSSLCILHGRDIVHLGALPFGFEAIATDIARGRGVKVSAVIDQALTGGIEAGVHLDRIIREVTIALHRIPEAMPSYGLIPASYAEHIRDMRSRFAAVDFGENLPGLKGVDYPGPTRDILLSFMATALAFRGVDTADMVNFRQGDQTFSKHMERIKGFMGFWGKLLLALIVLWVVGFGTDIFLKARIKKNLDAKIKQEFYSVYAPSTAMVAPVEQLQQRLATLQKGVGGAGGDSPLNILRSISERLPAETEAVIEGFTLDENGITISGTTASYDTVERIRSVLAGLPNISDVKIVSANVNKSDQRVMFKLTCKTGGA
ncbi:MAG TPA: pilus assembly protein PilM, partial [Deltaproteobacteria bacterium]|nr:pilus assembly protein PilM [Deltaproteobacteria bacterium]